MNEAIKKILDDIIFPKCAEIEYVPKYYPSIPKDIEVSAIAPPIPDHILEELGIALTDEAVVVIDGGKPIEETEKYIRIRVRNPGEFQEGSFRTVWLSRSKGINSVQGRLKGQTTMTVQSLLFLKTKWTRQRALAWVREHGYKPKGLIKEFEAGKETGLINVIPSDVELEKSVGVNLLIKRVDKKKRTIQGWASTRDLDSDNEVVLPSAFRDTLERFMRNPQMFYMHRWRDMFPIGRVLKAEIVEDVGLWIEAEITNITEEGKTVWKLIEAELLNAFSIGFSNAKREERDGVIYIVSLKLWEVSIVSLPANENALISRAKEKGIDVTGLNELTPITLEFKQVNDNKINEEVVTMEFDGKKVMERIDAIEVKQKEGLALMAEVQETVKSASTKAELRDLIEKTKGDILDTLDEKFKAVNQRKLRWEADIEGYGGNSFLRKPFKKHDLAFLGCASDEARFAKLFEIPSINMEDLQILQSAADDLLFTHWILQSFANDYAGMKSLKLYQRYIDIANDFAKAMDTATSGEGSEWIPTVLSADLVTKYRLALRVAGLFNWFNMPSSPYKYPLLTGGFTTYKIPENVGDIGQKILASTPATSSVTFTAAKLGARGVFSDEITEDSIVPILPRLKEELAKAMAEGVEDAIINGDTTATHQDSNVTSSYDRRKMYKGLRKLIIEGGENVDINAGGFAASDIRTLRNTMGKYGVNPAELVLIVSINAYIQMLSFTEVATVDKFGEAATWLKGFLTALDGVPIIISEFAQQNLNASGVYDGITTDNTAVILVHKPSYMVGERRVVTVKGKQDIETDQQIIVATQRLDLQKMYPTAETCGAYGYNIDNV